jgi:hypothetical protein
MPKSHVLQQRILESTLRAAAYTVPATVYVALFTATPTEAYTVGVPTGTEVTGGSYARVAATFAASVSGGASPSSTAANSGVITFPTASAGWGTVTSFGVFDAASAGNLLYFGNLTATQTVATGNTPTYAAGAIVIGED